jgi:hypothetical protein
MPALHTCIYGIIKKLKSARPINFSFSSTYAVIPCQPPPIFRMHIIVKLSVIDDYIIIFTLIYPIKYLKG